METRFSTKRDSRRDGSLPSRIVHASRVPSIFVNDNFDCWHLGFREIVTRVRNAEGPGKALLDDVTPDFRRDYFVRSPCTPASSIRRWRCSSGVSRSEGSC